MTLRDDIACYTMSYVQEKIQPIQLTAVTTKSTLITKQLVTICTCLSTILYMITHIHRYVAKGPMDTLLGMLIAFICFICFLFELITSFRGEIHLHFQEWKALSISIMCVGIVLLFSGMITAISILIFMCIEMAMTCIRIGFGGINPNALHNLILSSELELQSMPVSVLSDAGYFNGLQLIQRDFIEFYKDVNFCLFSTMSAAQRYPKETHIQIYGDLVNIYNFALDSYHTVLNRKVCCFRNTDATGVNNAQTYSLVLSKR